jgi:antitoxin ParD1/3/4
MANIEKISIALPQEMIESIRDAVDQGEYATTSEVIRDALRDWRFKRRVDALEVEELRKLVLPALASLDRGEGIPAEQVFDRLKSKYEKMVAAKARLSKSKTDVDLRRLVEEGLASGPSLDVEEVFSRLSNKLATGSKKARATKKRKRS